MQDQILDTTRRDLAAFADAGTSVEITDRGAVWQQNRRTMHIVFTRGEEELPRIQFGDQQYSYKGFFSSGHMADIPLLAESIQQSIPRAPFYVDAIASPEGSGETRSATHLLKTLSMEDLPFGATRVVFVRGSAGAGKTVALRQLALVQAEDVADGAASCLFFYIDAQARALARLDEAVALLLQDLGARFTYRALATLTRLGLVIPIIDGFDELLGTGGYGEAFDSLAKLLARLNGRGSLIASARSTFYEYRDFRESATRFERGSSLNFEISPVDIRPWTDAEVGEYLRLAGAVGLLNASTAEEAVGSLRSNLGEDGESFLRTPFFVATLVELLQQGATVSAEKRIVPQIINHFIARERDKLRDRQDLPILDDDGHRQFLEMLAEEMWWQGSRELDVETVKVIAELLAESLRLQPMNRVTLVERSPSYAFFESREHENRRFLGFTHEYYHAFFMGYFLARGVATEISLEQLLSRGRMSPLFGEEFANAVRERGYEPRVVANRLAGRGVPSLTREMNRSNAGVLYAGILRVTPSAFAGEVFSEAEFLQEDFTGTEVAGITFRRCELVRCNLRNAQWSGMDVADTRFVEPIVDLHTTSLGGLQLRIGDELIGIVTVSGQQEATVYDPVRVREICERIGVSPTGDELPGERVLSDRARSMIDLLHRFCRVAARLFYISDDDLTTRGLAASRYWRDLEKLLLDHQLLEFVVIQRRGPENRVRRLRVLPTELEQGESGGTRRPEVTSFWEAIRDC